MGIGMGGHQRRVAEPGDIVEPARLRCDTSMTIRRRLHSATRRRPASSPRPRPKSGWTEAERHAVAEDVLAGSTPAPASEGQSAPACRDAVRSASIASAPSRCSTAPIPPSPDRRAARRPSGTPARRPPRPKPSSADARPWQEHALSAEAWPIESPPRSGHSPAHRARAFLPRASHPVCGRHEPSRTCPRSPRPAAAAAGRSGPTRRRPARAPRAVRGGARRRSRKSLCPSKTGTVMSRPARQDRPDPTRPVLPIGPARRH